MNRREFIKSIFTAVVASQVPIDFTSIPKLNLLGLPYHENNATIGTWMGISRSTVPQWTSCKPISPKAKLAIIDLIRILERDKDARL